MPKVNDAEQHRNEKLRNAIDAGTDIVGGAIGGAVGIITGDPAIASALGAAGVAAGRALRYVGNEIISRTLGPRERERVGAVMSIILRDIHSRTNGGERVRTDGFFDPDLSDRSDAAEVAESVLLKCQKEPEEKKIPYMGHFFANVAFHPEVSAHLAHQLLKHAEQLTYRQFCLLKIALFDNDRPRLRNANYRPSEGSTTTLHLDLQQVLYEIHDLYNRGFVNFGGNAALGLTDVNPRMMKTQGLGTILSDLLRVIFIPQDDLEPIIEQLH